MTYNSVFEILAMVFILILAAFYQIRKEFTAFYRGFSFFTVWWILVTSCLKLLHDVAMGNTFIHFFLKDNPDSFLTKVNGVVFGGLRKERPLRAQLGYFGFLFLTIFFCQLWWTVKWLEIREAVGNMDESILEGNSWTIFWKYIEFRSMTD